MTSEPARATPVAKPWGVVNLEPWSKARHDDGAVGEIWYERTGRGAVPSLLFKLLFTSQPLSIQVHPGDAFARSLGLPNGKTEAWYVLNAVPGAKVALGLNQPVTPQQLHSAIDDGSIADLVVWQTVLRGDTVFVPAGTIHAIGAGLVIAEIQQRSDATFRLFDHGRHRELHVDHAIAVADAGPAARQVVPSRLTDDRTLLVASPFFVLERIELAPNSFWRLNAERETWLLAVGGSAHAGSLDLGIGDALFAQSEHLTIEAGPDGMVCLAAYTGVGPIPNLIQRLDPSDSQVPRQLQKVQVSPSLPHAKTAMPTPRLTASQ